MVTCCAKAFPLRTMTRNVFFLTCLDWQVDIEFTRNGEVFFASMFRMSTHRVQSIRDWMEVQSKNASHALAKADPLASQYSREMLEGLIQIVVEHFQFQEIMTRRIGQVCFVVVHLADIWTRSSPSPGLRVGIDDPYFVAASQPDRNAH